MKVERKAANSVVWLADLWAFRKVAQWGPTSAALTVFWTAVLKGTMTVVSWANSREQRPAVTKVGC